MIVILNQQQKKRRKGGEANPLDSEYENIIKGRGGRAEREAEGGGKGSRGYIYIFAYNILLWQPQ